MAGLEYDFSVTNLGECKIKSPIELSRHHGDFRATFVRDDAYVRRVVNSYDEKPEAITSEANHLEKAGPREYIYFDPQHVTAGICTCGGLCPGLNDVIRAVVRTL